jgi:MFS family permease
MVFENSLPPEPVKEAEALRGRGRTFDALRIRNYRWFWLGVLSSFFGMIMSMLAQSWLTYELTHSPLKLGLVTAGFGVPTLLISPFAGVVADRVRKRNIIIMAQGAIAIVTLITAILITSGLIQYWHLLIAALLTGLTMAFSMPCQQAMVPGIVPRERLYNAIALNSGAMNLSRVAGPALAGALIGFIGTGGVYFSALGCFAIAVAALSMVNEPRSKVSSPTRSATTEFKEGLSYIRQNIVVLTLLSMDFTITLFGMSYQQLMPVFADLLEVQALGYGFLMTMVGIGALFGSLGIASLRNFRSKGKLLVTAGVALGTLLVLFANSHWFGQIMGMGKYTFYLACFLLMLVGAATTSYTSTSATIIQMNITDGVRGRVMGIYGIVFGLMPMGALLSGAIAEAISAPRAITISGAILALFMITMAFTNQRVKRLE